VACYAAAVQWARTEGTIPAPETSHAIATVINEAKRATEEGKAKDILFCYSGHGLMDLVGYQKYLAGSLQPYHLSEEDLQASLKAIADHPPAEQRKTGRWKKKPSAKR
jgi:tryptophan synthase beta chain